MESQPEIQGHSTAINGWGSVSNKHLFDWIVEHETAWDTRESVIRQMDPKMKNVSVEQKAFKRERESATDFFERMSSIRNTTASLHNTGWREDVERDEGGRFSRLNSQM